MSNSRSCNPFGIAYKSLANIVSLFGHPGGMVAVGENFWTANDPTIAQLRKLGCKVLAYFDVIQVPDDLTKVTAYKQLYAKAALWQYPTLGVRVSYAGDHLSDIRAGSPWSQAAIQIMSDLIKSNIVDGALLDEVGGQLWSPLVAWDSWPQAEKDTWTIGNVDFISKVDAIRRDLNPDFILVNNNIWQRQDGSTLPALGAKHVNGSMIEHHKPDPKSATGVYAGQQFCGFGQRVVIPVATSTANAVAWSDIEGTTYACDQLGNEYGQVKTPCLPFTRLDYSMKP